MSMRLRSNAHRNKIKRRSAGYESLWWFCARCSIQKDNINMQTFNTVSREECYKELHTSIVKRRVIFLVQSLLFTRYRELFIYTHSWPLYIYISSIPLKSNSTQTYGLSQNSISWYSRKKSGPTEVQLKKSSNSLQKQRKRGRESAWYKTISHRQ